MGTRAFVHWAFDHYLDIAHPSYALAHAEQPAPRALRAAA
jgi:hypothetical protein